jgi:hypothetical protein
MIGEIASWALPVGARVRTGVVDIAVQEGFELLFH